MVYLGSGHRFLVLYGSHEIEVKDFGDPHNPLVEERVQLNEDIGFSIDIAFVGDETQVIVGFIDGQCAFVNMKSKAVTYFDHRLLEPLKVILPVSHLPPSQVPSVFLLSRGGTYRAFDFQQQYQDVAKFGAQMYFSDNRLFSFIIELDNDSKNTLGYSEPMTTIAFPIHQKGLKN
jgi:hypothetical protein